jgi:2'-5' RNA ligase
MQNRKTKKAICLHNEEGYTMRLFIAINFNEKTRAKLATIQRNIRSQAPRGRFPNPANFHLTLVFLGECDDEQLKAAQGVLSSTLFTPFELSFERVGCFRRRGGDLWWAGIALTRELQQIQADLSSRLQAAGFVLDSRPFQPHVTLARQINQSVDIPAPFPFSETVRSIELMESTRINGRLTYKPLFGIVSQ